MRVVLLAEYVAGYVAELVAGAQLHATHGARETRHVVDAGEGAHHLLAAQYGLRARLALAADAARAVNLDIVVATQELLVAREALIAQLAQRHLAHVTLEAVHVPQPVETLEQVAVTDRRLARRAQSMLLLMLLLLLLLLLLQTIRSRKRSL